MSFFKQNGNVLTPTLYRFQKRYLRLNTDKFTENRNMEGLVRKPDSCEATQLLFRLIVRNSTILFSWTSLVPGLYAAPRTANVRKPQRIFLFIRNKNTTECSEKTSNGSSRIVFEASKIVPPYLYLPYLSSGVWEYLREQADGVFRVITVHGGVFVTELFLPGIPLRKAEDFVHGSNYH